MWERGRGWDKRTCAQRSVLLHLYRGRSQWGSACWTPRKAVISWVDNRIDRAAPYAHTRLRVSGPQDLK